MKFGLHFVIQSPSLDDHTRIEEALEQGILADEMGWDSLWFVEHHFLTTYSMSPCPEVIYGALSRLTKRIRLGFGVMILPYHHPIRVAERVAMVDQLSKGRVEFGTGRSAVYEQTGMGIDPRDTRDMWEESLTMIPKIWDSDMFEWQGRFWKVPPRKVLPKPYQTPHPPLWTAGLQPSTYALAAQMGIGLMALGLSAPAVLEPHVKTYKQDIKKAKPVGKFVNNQWLSTTMGYCHEDARAAREECAQSLKVFFGPDKPYTQGQKDLYATLVQQWGGVPDHLKSAFSRYIKTEEDPQTGERKETVDLSGGGSLAQRAWEGLDGDTLVERGVIVAGDPDDCIKAIKLHEATGVDQLDIIIASETLPHKKVMKSIEMFGKHVLPAFKKAPVAAKK